MSEHVAAEPKRGPRLNPFVFPSDTTFRFALLVAAVLGANLYIWNWLWFALGTDERRVALSYFDCSNRLQAGLQQAGGDLAGSSAARRAFTVCLQHVNRPLAWWMIGGTALLLVVTALLVFVRPLWIARRLRPLGREDAPDVAVDLGALAREGGLSEEPRWLWNPLDPAPTGLAIGRPGRHAVALTGGLVMRWHSDRAAFRAVVRHELSHLRNGDVDVTYLTVSLWHAFLLVAVLPFAVVVADEDATTIVRLGWRMCALALLVYLTRNAVLRSREVYADVRASVVDGQDGGLRRLLASLPRTSASAWTRLRSVHPSGDVRLASVDDTRRLFPLAPIVAFGTGIATTIAYESVVTLLDLFIADPFTMRLLAACVFAPLAMGVVGMGVWRGTWGALADGHVRPQTWILALSFVGGVLVGPELAFQRAIRGSDDTLLSTAFRGSAPWIAALVLGVVLLVAWAGASAEGWLRAVAISTRPAAVTLAGLLVASGVLAVLVGTFYGARDSRLALVAERGSTELQHAEVSHVAWAGPVLLWRALFDPGILVVVRRDVVFLAVVALWLFPAAAWAFRRTRGEETSWAYLDPGGRLSLKALGRLPREPWRIGLLAGLGFLACLILLRLGLRNGVAADTRAEDTFLFAFLFWQLALALLAQLIAGAFAASRSRELPPLAASLAAAFVTGVIATAGIVVGPTVAGCVDPIALNPLSCTWDVDGSLTWDILRVVVVEGALASLAAGSVVVAVTWLLHRRREPEIHPAGVPG
jgi:Zn-dependent protease with chaperone function